MKRAIYWFFIAFLSLLALISAGWVFYPAIPNTPSAKRGFHEMTGAEPSEVSAIHYYYSGEFISGGDAEYLRFTYPDELWLQRFLNRLGLHRLANSGGGLFTDGVPSWWDYSTIWSLSECYGLNSEHTPNQMTLWIDRQHRFIYLYFGNPQRLALEHAGAS